MYPIYVKEWHRISLRSLKNYKPGLLPTFDFYREFYREFFNKHQGWEDLDPKWVEHKMNIARFVQGRIFERERVLSIGCGFGIIEKHLWESGSTGLEIQEISEEPLRWVRPLLKNEAVHIGRFPECMKNSKKYELIFLSNVEYCFNQNSWVNFLKTIRKNLGDNGCCLIITPILPPVDHEWFKIYLKLKERIKHVLSFSGLFDFGQFVGWRRTKDDLRDSMTMAGFKIREDGVLERGARKLPTYWIEGSTL